MPLYGDAGLFSGWNFALVDPGNQIAAYDPDGALQWTYQPDWNVDPSAGGYQLDAWAFVSGRIMVMHLRGMVVALDLTQSSRQSPPQLLWRMKSELSSSSDPDLDPRNFALPEERIEQYQLLPGGHFPLGPVSEFGVPLISGRTLQMLNLFTGARLWELDVIPVDARLLIDDDRLLILSDSARQTEVRSAIDGTLLATHRLPDWWSEAGSNQGLSVEEIDVEAGMDTIWRVLVEGRRCVLFRLTAGEGRLECHDLLTEAVLWQHTLPQKTVFSNVADNATALLSDGQQLKIVDLTNGAIRVNQKLTPVVQPRKLYLRSSQGLFVILPEAALRRRSLDGLLQPASRCCACARPCVRDSTGGWCGSLGTCCPSPPAETGTLFPKTSAPVRHATAGAAESRASPELTKLRRGRWC
ncbi:MAG UNVERIFIED_CONTAM: hypothetical protein LVR18_02805 [Planctomycetaceae bacterium]